MEPRIEELQPKTLIGIMSEMSLSDNKTSELWQKFMPRRGEIKNRATNEFISLQNYGENWNFSPNQRFKKWALVEVSSADAIPAGMESYRIKGGKYAVFSHCGPASDAPVLMKYIFGEWIPKSKYTVDNREHFEVLPEGYNPMAPQAKEDIWIPIKE